MSVICPKCQHSFVVSSKITTPKEGSLCAQVWDLARNLEHKLGRRPTRTEIVLAGVQAGLNPSTTLTQYGRFVKANQKSE
jgi:hypothetical protein